MICPDSRHALREQIRHGVTVDQCPYCGGVWFDAGELDAVRRAARYGRPASDVEERSFRPDTGSSEKVCPRCPGSRLRSGYIDDERFARCPSCGGLWIPHVPGVYPSGGSEWKEVNPTVLEAGLDLAFDLVGLLVEIAFGGLS